MNVTILGGGSAGWITALLMNRAHPTHNITLIESDEIGILGAGEGTTGEFVKFLDKVGISCSDVVKNCQGTLKLGINFQNWNGDGKSYFHHFNAADGLNEFNVLDMSIIDYCLAKGIPVDSFNFSKKLTENNKVPFTFVNNLEAPLTNNINYFQPHGAWAMHFNARELAKYFRTVAESRGVNRVEGKLSEVIQDPSGNIKTLKLENGSSVDCDFVFDCSGFARLLIGKHYNTEWVSYKDHLPLDTALPFFVTHDGNYSPKTDAIAMKYGWVWRIPVEGRYGCGYVFDSSYINEDQAKREVEETFNIKLDSTKTFKFKAGTFAKTLVNNCMAVGLSQSFVEPLEASSIMVSLMNLDIFIQNDGLNRFKEIEAEFNEWASTLNIEVRDFLHVHYLTKRDDSEFWKQFRNKNTTPLSAERTLSRLNNVHDYLDDKAIWTTPSWIQVCGSLGLIDSSNSKTLLMQKDLNVLSVVLKLLQDNQDNIIHSCLTVDHFNSYMKRDFSYENCNLQ